MISSDINAVSSIANFNSNKQCELDHNFDPFVRCATMTLMTANTFDAWVGCRFNGGPNQNFSHSSHRVLTAITLI